jgi:hypothetical protein
VSGKYDIYLKRNGELDEQRMVFSTKHAKALYIYFLIHASEKMTRENIDKDKLKAIYKKLYNHEIDKKIDGRDNDTLISFFNTFMKDTKPSVNRTVQAALKGVYEYSQMKTEENKKKAANAANVLEVKKALQDAQKNPRKDPNQAISKYLHRKAVETQGYKKLNVQKELEWLNSVLPQLSRNNKIRIIEGLIRCSDGTWDYGQMKNGLIYIGTNGKEGTVYHEAFHAVTQWILTDEELDALYEAARERYGNLDTVTLEEKMADDFMLYTMGVRPSYKPKTQNIFKRLWDAIKRMFKQANMIDRLYQNINDGVYAEAVLKTPENEFADITSEDRGASMEYAFLDSEQRGRLKDNKVSRDQYEVLDSQEKRYLFHCVI